MITINHNTLKLESIFSDLTHRVKGKFISQDFIKLLEFDNNIGKGSIKDYQVSPTINFVEYDVVFNEDFFFTNENAANSINFIYCLKGDFEYTLNNYSRKQFIYELQHAINIQHKDNTTTIYVNKGVHYKACFITLNKEKLETEHLLDKIVEFFNSETINSDLFHLEYLNFKVIQKIKELDELDLKTANDLMIKGMIETIIGLQIQLYAEGKQRRDDQIGDLSTHDIRIGRKLIEGLKNRLEEKLTIPRLSRETGKSPAKLQKIFKLMHNQTVSEFITNERLKCAEQLIREKDLTVSEVAYTVGISSRSYFSKIFKKRYNCNPKLYQDKVMKNKLKKEKEEQNYLY